MRHKAFYIAAAFGILLVLTHACKKENRGGPDNARPEPVTLALPPGFPDPVYSFANNPLTKEGIALGRFMFYDYRLSKDSTVSCGFCHQQFAAFGHFDHALSHGVGGQQGTRSVPVIFNMIWQRELMWDGGVNNLEIQPLTPLTDHKEMGVDLKELIQKMQGDPKYRQQFKAAFGTEEVTTERMFKAITQFVATMISGNSRYDSIIRKVPGAAFTPDEAAGYQLYQQKCAACHKEPLFTDLTYRSNGLPYLAALNDVGRMKITNNTADYLKFKVPSLRNILRSSPYMHDGRYFDIFQVFDFYDHGVQVTASTDPLVKNGIPLTDQQKRQLYLFLNTLTDYTLINNKSLSEVLIEP
ncbi:cytochrome-c peroxidase [Chitinophaga qingshengii]|uniref:Cytochrome-c peroxidase n=1 Tax=Chitinophaga qingshengii TaxID=1569794 RepID=A0ABR7TLG2_9BACT|nr:cytochrome c peroxidase [Chitinophaga qingshengii]MBC9930356.1 cytochrome-c peroxidase [Chitinophaga qingshengii]